MKKSYILIAIIAVTAMLLIFTCSDSGNRKKHNPKRDTTLVAQPPIVKTINVYIENSGSMDGYINGNYEFKDAISSLLAKLPFYYNEKDIKIRFINSRIDSISTTQISLTNFSKELNVYWDKGKKIRSDSTNLNNIFQNILSQTDSTAISILFSDCIYSIGKGDVIGLLNYEKNLTMSAFLQKYKKDSVSLATTILKMKSHFKGWYYPYTSDKNRFKIDMERPYYICVIGSNRAIQEFYTKLPLEKEKIEGFENKYVLSAEDAKNIYYSVLQSSYNKGRFKPDRDDREESNKDYIHGITDVDLPRGVKHLTLAVAVDFSNVEAGDDYLKNSINYIVTTDNFSIDTIIPLEKNKIRPNDWNIISSAKPTHIIILTAKTEAVSDLSFVLKKQIPQWVFDSNIESDTDTVELKGTTFGLSYWVTGIEKAFETIYPNNQNFFECNISIR